jgi:organic radical activating enzyme
MKQTAMQELLEEVILERQKSISVEFRDALDFVITAIKTDYKEIEKQQIIDAQENGQSIYSDIIKCDKSKQYYKETFNK